MARTKSKHEVQADASKFVAVITVLGGIVTKLIPWAAICYIAHNCYLSIASLSGQETVLDFAFKCLANVKINQWVAWTIAGLSGGGWVFEHRLRRKKTDSLAQQNQELRELIDKKVPSQGRTGKGII